MIRILSGKGKRKKGKRKIIKPRPNTEPDLIPPA
jgi:hypothetical protein